MEFVFSLNNLIFIGLLLLKIEYMHVPVIAFVLVLPNNQTCLVQSEMECRKNATNNNTLMKISLLT